MPKGEPNRQTIATKKYQEKAGYVAKSYKLKKDLVRRFADACGAAGVTQAGKLSELMERFIKEQR